MKKGRIRFKINGEWIDTTTMSTALMSTGDVANKEGRPSVFSEVELKLTLEYDLAVVPPVRQPAASATLAFGPSSAQSLAGNATINTATIKGETDGTVVTWEAEIKFSGLVTLGA